MALHRIDPTAMRPKTSAHKRPGWCKADQEGDQEQDRQLDICLNVAPQIHRHIEPIVACEQRDGDCDQNPKQGLQEMHVAPFRRAAR